MRSFLGCLGLLVVVGALGLVGLGFRIFSLPFRAVDRTVGTAEGVIDKTLTADNAIYNYEWFKQQHEDIKAAERKIDLAAAAVASFEASAGARTGWTFEDKTEDARLRSIELGIRSQYESMVGDYNARAKMANRNIFQDGKIPGFIEIGSRLLK